MQIANRRARKRATLLIFVEDVFVKKSPANKRIHLENSPNNVMRLNWLVSGLFRKWGSTHCKGSFVNEPSFFDSFAKEPWQIIEAQANCQGSSKSSAPHRANKNGWRLLQETKCCTFTNRCALTDRCAFTNRCALSNRRRPIAQIQIVGASCKGQIVVPLQIIARLQIVSTLWIFAPLQIVGAPSRKHKSENQWT